MEVTLIGYLCLAMAAASLFLPAAYRLVFLAIMIPLEAAAAINLPAFGSTSILCANVAMAAVLGSILLRPVAVQRFFRLVSTSRAFQFFLLFSAYGVLSAFLLPRLFEGDVSVFSFARDAGPGPVSLAASTGNITQSVFLLGEAGLLAGLLFYLTRPGGLRHAALIMNTITSVFLFFAFVNLFQGTGAGRAVLDAIRTANYAIHDSQTMLGFTRIIGASTEPSAFGSLAATLFAYNAVRFTQTRGPLFALSSVALVLCVIASFSTTGYAVLVILAALWGVRTSFLLFSSGLRREDLLALFSASIVGAMAIGVMFWPPMQSAALGLADSLFGQKLASASGVERSSWNSYGWSNFIDTYGIGIGLGSARTSSHVLSVLSNTGIIGMVLYFGFLRTSIARAWPAATPADGSDVAARRLFYAARAAAVAHLAGVIVSGTLARPGTMFIVTSSIAIAAAYALREPRALIDNPFLEVVDDDSEANGIAGAQVA